MLPVHFFERSYAICNFTMQYATLYSSASSDYFGIMLFQLGMSVFGIPVWYIERGTALMRERAESEKAEPMLFE